MLDAFGQPQSMVVLGATSDIARAVVRALAPRRCRTVVLAGRDAGRLQEAANEASGAGASRVSVVRFDASNIPGAAATVDECFAAAGSVDVVLVAVGELSLRGEELDAARTASVTAATFGWPSSAVSRAAALLVEQGHGRVVVLSSVAAVKTRLANLVYGSSKAGMDAFALGLGEVLRGTGVSVQVVRPGFVRTKMTAGLPDAPFATTAQDVAAAVVDGLESNASIIWVPPVLRWVFLALRFVPRVVWRRLSA